VPAVGCTNSVNGHITHHTRELFSRCSELGDDGDRGIVSIRCCPLPRSVAVILFVRLHCKHKTSCMHACKCAVNKILTSTSAVRHTTRCAQGTRRTQTRRAALTLVVGADHVRQAARRRGDVFKLHVLGVVVDVRAHAIQGHEAVMCCREGGHHRRVIGQGKQAVRSVQRAGAADANLEACTGTAMSK